MTNDAQLIQNPAPGTRLVRFCGDTLTLTLTLPHAQSGTAWVRTNIGHAKIIRDEIIREVERNETPLGRAWFDLPMRRVGDQNFIIHLPLWEVGHFEAKSFFLKEGQIHPVWPPGHNTAVNVQPSDACSANIIYNAFVRQFGPNKTKSQLLESPEFQFIQKLDKRGYAVIPPSGTFRDLIAELDFIIGELGCRILLLLPIHPTPTTYGRMGRFGSPYAALSFTTVDPALAEFDPHATPLEQFVELVDAIHQRNAKIFIDIAINHTGWAADLHETHPNWLVRSPEGRIEVPEAWGVAWEDLTKLDYSQTDLWQYMANVFLTWCRRGVDGFRCDAGYMIPVSAWRYIVAKVRQQYPNTVFLLEGLGGKISVTRELLNTANLNWAYSELFQNYDRQQIEHYLPEAIDISNSDGITVHFAETHDNPRLAARSKTYAQMRTALCALCSHNGAFGFANGVEWFATEKINVHDSPSLNWGSGSNQVAQIRRINHLLKVHPAFHAGAALKLIEQNAGNYLVVLRDHQASGKKLLVVVNLDDKNPTQATWDPTAAGIVEADFTDLLSDQPVTVSASKSQHALRLEPGQVVCLSPDRANIEQIQQQTERPYLLPQRIEQQRRYAKILEVLSVYSGTRDIETLDQAQAARQLKEDPFNFCKRLNPHVAEPRVVTWQWPRDLKREVMIPPDHFLLIRVECAFRAQIINEGKTVASEESLPDAHGSFFALVAPLTASKTAQTYTLKLSLYFPQGCRHEKAPLCILPRPGRLGVNRIILHSELLQKQFVFLATNDHGAMSRSLVSWGKLSSRYDGLLAANLSPAYPEDRWMMFSRCRAWVVFQDYSQEINSHCLEAFQMPQAFRGSWQYHIPTGQGENVLLTVSVEMIDDKNTVRLNFFRHPAEDHQDRLANSKPIKLILRPDIENRNCHSTTKAYVGPEDHWPNSVKALSNGFQFSPDDAHHLQMQISAGTFVWEPEWQYMVHRSTDAERGQDPNSDLFSPGYFQAFVQGSQQVTLWAQVNSDHAAAEPPAPDPSSIAAIELDKVPETIPPVEVLKSSLDQYVVKRGDLKTVIAGYPWFLDWGRDALIFVRGLVAAEKFADARAVLKQFGRFEDRGTLPNMIRGNDAGNRDTSDAPLWFFTACADLVAAEGGADFLQAACGRRSVREVLLSIGQSMISGTPSGIRMDPASGLIFSPTHFSWMDTNHPASTPREGYPVEIQALWYAALGFLSKIDPSQTKTNWQTLSEQVQRSILTRYWLEDGQYLSDCLHATAETPAKDATADDCLRPNQLLAITLGAVSDPTKCECILAACQELLVPGAIRSLADRPVRQALKIVHQGKLINDPHHPYHGKYVGDEDTQRKPAYHNGTAWTWLFPSFCEAWAMTYGAEGTKTALAWLSSSIRLLERGCLDHIPEILDGDYPHTQRGCDAQAWGVSELLRVWRKLEKEKSNQGSAN